MPPANFRLLYTVANTVRHKRKGPSPRAVSADLHEMHRAMKPKDRRRERRALLEPARVKVHLLNGKREKKFTILSLDSPALIRREEILGNSFDDVYKAYFTGMNFISRK